MNVNVTPMTEMKKMKTPANNITVPVTNVRKAMRESGARGVVKIPAGKRNVRVNLSAVPRNFLERLALTPLSEMLAEKVQAHLKETLVVPGTDPFETMVSGPQELWTVLNTACQAGKPSLETQFPNGEWYPIAIQTHVHNGMLGEFLRIQANAKVCDHNERMDIRIFGPFVDPENNPVKRSVKDILQTRRLRPLTPERLEVFRKRQAKLRGIVDKTGLVLDNTKPVLYVNRFLWMQSLDTRDLGTPESPATVIVEPSLESASQEDYYDEDEGETTLTYPFVRVFSLDLKKYVYADVEAVVPHVYPVANKDRIVLPTEIRSVLDNIFDAGNSKLFSDAFSGRHGGMVILANGPSGVGKCLGQGTPVLLANGEVRPVEDIVIGDRLMGPDGTARTVLSINNGFGELYQITPRKGAPWVCNDVHMLTLIRSQTGEVVDIPLDEYLKKSRSFWNTHKLFSVGVSKFEGTKSDLPVDPYFLGVWFGDGSKHLRELSDGLNLTNIGVSNMDPEIVRTCEKTAKKWGLKVSVNTSKPCPTYFLVGTERLTSNPLVDVVRTLVGTEVNMPKDYLTASRDDRLQFLAGLLDADGDLVNNCFTITQKREDWARSILFVARSLGFAATIKHKKGGYRKSDGTAFVGNYFRVTISGHIDEIPVQIPRKQPSRRKQIKVATHKGFSTHSIGKGNYFGFTLDGDGRFLLGDFTVTHNTLTAEVFSQTVQRPLYILEVGELGTNVTTVEENLEKIFARAARWNAVLLFDEADIFLTARDERDLERNAIVGVFLRLLDYYQGTFFLTTNRAEVLDPAFKSRITLRLDYPGLDHTTRQRIWEIMLTAAKFDTSNVNLEVVSETNVNGRQIRNMVRLLTVLNPTKTINTVDVERVLRFTA
jgi:hypothetical protein